MPVDPPDRIAEVRVETMVGCPNEGAFLALVRSKAPPEWQIRGPGEPREGAPAPQFVVALGVDPTGEARGRLEGGGEARVIEGTQCATVAEAIAFSLVLRLQETKHQTAVAPSVPPAPAASPSAPGIPPPVAPPRLADRDRARLWFQAGAELSATWGTTPNPLGGALFVGAGATLGAFTPGLRASFVHGFVGRPDPLANASFEAYGLRVDTCPITARIWRLRVSPCVGVGIYAIALQTGADVVIDVQDPEGTADGLANPRVNILALARTQVRTVDPLLLELSLGLTANPVVEAYSLDEHAQAWEGSVLGPFVAVALGTSIE